MLLQLISVGWGQDDPAFRQFYTSQYIPDASTEQFRTFNESLRRAASPENASRLLRALQSCDLRNSAPWCAVQPSSCIRVDDRRVPLEQGRALAAAIAGARFVPLNSRNHYPLPHEPAWTNFIEELNAFLPPGPAPSRPSWPWSTASPGVELPGPGADRAGNRQRRESASDSASARRPSATTSPAILSKMDVHTRAEAIVQARNAGFGLECGT